VIVVDASVLAVALGDDGCQGATARSALTGRTLVAPELVDLEVVSVWRRQVAAGRMSADRAEQALVDLISLPLRRNSHRPLMGRCWALRQTVTVYDAAYIALAEALEVALLTADARLSRAPGLRCQVELLTSPPR
jgi:predicted nucleic acid-binding protein